MDFSINISIQNLTFKQNLSRKSKEKTADKECFHKIK